MDRKKYVESMYNNLGFLKLKGIVPNDSYMCPLCMQSFSLEEVRTKMTEEDVPQASLGGRRIALTCRTCNSTCGHTIDINLLNAIISDEQRKYLPLTNRKVRVLHGNQRLNAQLRIDANRNMFLEINTKANNPTVWDDYRENVLKENALLDLQDVQLKRDERFISAALLKNAYLLLFTKTGYTFLSDSYYNDLRKQIRTPKPYILPERLWTMQDLNVDDGIYLCKDNRLRGFFVIYTLSKMLKYRVCAFIPVPNVPYIAAAYYLREFDAHSRIRIERLPDYMDFFNNSNDILRLRKWCYGWGNFMQK